MSNLVVFDFDGIHTADEVLNKLRSLEKEYLIDLEDACVVERDDNGRVHIKQAVNLAALGAATGGSRGALWTVLSAGSDCGCVATLRHHIEKLLRQDDLRPATFRRFRHELPPNGERAAPRPGRRSAVRKGP
jgi:hypothetical protein